jgi:transcriptional regulator with XRE-family HTH domain
MEVYMDEVDRERAQAITRLREKKLWSRRQLAREAGMSPSAIPYIEEHRGSVRLETIGKIAKALDVDPEVILYPDEHQEEIYGPKAEAPPSSERNLEERRALAKSLFESMVEQLKSLPTDYEATSRTSREIYTPLSDVINNLVATAGELREDAISPDEAADRLDEIREAVEEVEERFLHAVRGGRS